MSLRPFWQRHPVLLRIAAALTLALFPLAVLAYMVQQLWEARESVAKLYRDAWGYMVNGAGCRK